MGGKDMSQRRESPAKARLQGAEGAYREKCGGLLWKSRDLRVIAWHSR